MAKASTGKATKPTMGKNAKKAVQSGGSMARNVKANTGGKIPPVGSGKKRLDPNVRMLALAKAKLALRKRGGSGKA